MKTYSERLLDPRWQRRRLEILQRSDFSCEGCGANDKTLHVHHKLYRKGAMPWEYEDHELHALCKDCHQEEHEVRERLTVTLARLEIGDLEEVLGYADGLVAKRTVFTDGYSRTEGRVWPVTSYSHARGFGICLRASMTPEQVYEVVNLQPIGDFEVEWLGTEGLPSEFAEKAKRLSDLSSPEAKDE